MFKLFLGVAVLVAGCASFAFGDDEPVYSGVVRIERDKAVLATDNGDLYRIAGDDVANLMQYRGARVNITGMTMPPQSESTEPILYAKRIEICGGSRQVPCKYEPEEEPVPIPPF
jgi:hypothetical protein